MAAVAEQARRLLVGEDRQTRLVHHQGRVRRELEEVVELVLFLLALHLRGRPNGEQPQHRLDARRMDQGAAAEHGDRPNWARTAVAKGDGGQPVSAELANDLHGREAGERIVGKQHRAIVIDDRLAWRPAEFDVDRGSQLAVDPQADGPDAAARLGNLPDDAGVHVEQAPELARDLREELLARAVHHTGRQNPQRGLGPAALGDILDHRKDRRLATERNRTQRDDGVADGTVVTGPGDLLAGDAGALADSTPQQTRESRRRPSGAVRGL